MNILAFASIAHTCYMVKHTMHKWAERVVTQIKNILPHLQDSRLGAASIFMMNVAFAEIATRVSHLIILCFFEKTEKKSQKEWAYQWSTTGLMVLVGNVMLMKLTKISLSPLTVCALSILGFTAKFLLEKSINFQPFLVRGKV